MKWKSKVLYYGKKQTYRTFLVFPLELDYQVRWLEFATIEQIYGPFGWVDAHWVDDEASV